MQGPEEGAHGTSCATREANTGGCTVTVVPLRVRPYSRSIFVTVIKCPFFEVGKPGIATSSHTVTFSGSIFGNDQSQPNKKKKVITDVCYAKHCNFVNYTAVRHGTL